MSKRSELTFYISQLRRRLQLHAWVLGSTIITVVALLTTITLALILNHFAFPAAGVNSARFALALSLGIIIALVIILPLFRPTPARAVSQAEATHSIFEQRLTTFQDYDRVGDDPFLELLAADTFACIQNISPCSIAPTNRLFAIAGVGLGCLATLIWVIAAKPGFIGYGAALLWTGEHRNASPLYTLSVVPGNATVRRNSDQLVSVRVVGLHPDKVQLFARYQSAKAWEPVGMQAQPDLGQTATYQFVFAGLPESIEYYVKAGPLISPHYQVRVVDLPFVKGIRVDYQYPQWTGIKPTTQDQGGDLRAIENTVAHIQVEMDKPLTEGRLALDDNQVIQLSAAGANKYTGTIRMNKDGAYHIAAMDEGQIVRLSEDYFIATDKAEPPEVSVTQPSGDYRASPIEEVTMHVQSAAQFGLRDLQLHYSVNGGPYHDVEMLRSQGQKNTEGSHTIRLEDYKLVPGDLVSVYVTAKDGHLEARTNISFIQVDPFEREFSQSQQSPGGGGGSGGQNNQTDMSKRQKELIAETWKQQNYKTSNAKEAASTAQFLADAQSKLREQVMALSARMNSRDLSEANEEFTVFDREMQQAAAAMAPSVERLKEKQWKDALPLEQKALQALLRAEATFRQIQVAFGQQNGGGGGSTNSAGRDLVSLFDLELDTEKNQYETAENTSPADKQQKDIDDVLSKLDALTKRQDELSKQQKDAQQSFQERWQQEMLRREAEQIQREMEQLTQKSEQYGSARQNQQSTSPTGQSGRRQQQTSSSRNSGTSFPSNNSVQDQRIQQALSRLRQAGEAMKRNNNQQQRSDAAHEAIDRLQEARSLLSNRQQQLASGRLGSLSQEADRISQEERTQSDRIDRFGIQSAGDPMDRTSIEARAQQRNQFAEERQQLSNDLSKLQQDLRESARAMVSNQPDTAQKLRQALTGMDESDLDNHMQRTADWLRRGINPNSNGTESEIARQLQKLSQQLHEAQRDMRPGNPESTHATHALNQTEALDQLRRMREYLEGSGNPINGNATPKSDTKNGTGRRNTQQLRAGGQGELSPDQNAHQGGPQANDIGRVQSGYPRQGASSGKVHSGGSGYGDNIAWNNINTGNNTHASRASAPLSAPTQGDTSDNELIYDRQLRNLDRLGQMVQGDTGLSKEVQNLQRRMQQLDPKRFPGNPELVEQMHREMLSSINQIEIQIINKRAETEVRSGRSFVIPPGYQDSVADYYRRLSKSH